MYQQGQQQTVYNQQFQYAPNPQPNYYVQPQVIPQQNYYPQQVPLQNPINVNINIRRMRYDPESKSTGSLMIMDQIMRSLKAQNKEIDLDLTSLAVSLNNLDRRMTKTVMEMIFDFHASNPTNVQIMGRKDGAPYGGIYKADHNDTDFDLKNFPESLILILNEFFTLMKTHTTTQTNGKGVYHNGAVPRYGTRKQVP